MNGLVSPLLQEAEPATHAGALPGSFSLTRVHGTEDSEMPPGMTPQQFPGQGSELSGT